MLKKIKIAKGKKHWEKGQSCASNPKISKYRSLTEFGSATMEDRCVDFIAQDLVNMISKYFPNFEIDPEDIVFDKNSISIYKILGSFSGSEDFRLGILDLIIKLEFKNDQELVCGILWLFKNILIGGFRISNEKSYILIMKNLIFILKGYKNNFEVITLCFSILNLLIKNESLNTQISEAVNLFIFSFVKCIESEQKEIRNHVHKYFSNNNLITRVKSDLLFGYINYLLKIKTDSETYDSYLKFINLICLTNNYIKEIMEIFITFLKTCTSAQYITILNHISSNYEVFLSSHESIFLFKLILDKSSDVNDSNILTVVRILCQISKNSCALTDSDFSNLLDFMNYVCTNAEENIAKISLEIFTEIFDNCLIESRNYILRTAFLLKCNKILESNTHELFKTSNLIKFNTFVLNIYFKNFGTLNAKVNLLESIVRLRESSTNLRNSKEIDDFTSELLRSVPISDFLIMARINEDFDYWGCRRIEWAFSMILSTELYSKLDTLDFSISLLYKLYSKLSDFNKIQDKSYQEIWQSAIFKILKVINLNLKTRYFNPDYKIDHQILMDLFKNFKDFRKVIISFLNHYHKNLDKNDTNLWLTFLCDFFISSKISKCDSCNFKKGFLALFKNLDLSEILTFHAQITNLQTNSTDSEKYKFSKLLFYCYPFLPLNFTLNSLKNFYDKIFLPRVKIEKYEFKNIVNMIVSVNLETGCSEEEKSQFLSLSINFINKYVKICKKIYFGLITKCILHLFEYFSYNDFKIFFPHVCKFLKNPTSNTHKRSLAIIKLSANRFFNSLNGNSENDRIFDLSFVHDLFNNEDYKIGAVELIKEIILLDKNPNIYTKKLSQKLLKNAFNVGKRGFKTILGLFYILSSSMDKLEFMNILEVFFQKQKYLNDIKVMNRLTGLAKMSDKILTTEEIERMRGGNKFYRRLHNKCFRKMFEEKDEMSEESEYDFEEESEGENCEKFPIGIVKKNKKMIDNIEFPTDSSGKLIITDDVSENASVMDIKCPPEILQINDNIKSSKNNEENVKTRPGERFKARKAGGDKKLKNEFEPYAFIPLRRAALKKGSKNQFKGIIKNKNQKMIKNKY